MEARRYSPPYLRAKFRSGKLAWLRDRLPFHGVLGLIPVGAAQWQAAPAVVGIAQQGLVELKVTATECRSGSGHVEQPDAVGLFRYELEQRGAIALQAFDPAAEGQFIVLAEIFEIADFEASSLSRFERLRNRDQFA